MSTRNRPLSPHLQVYRLPLTAKLSISHRATGVGLALGALFLTYWLTSAAYGPDTFNRAQWFFGTVIGRILLLGFTFAFFFHLCNGIRHLFWDAGKGFELDAVRRSGVTVVVAAVVLTLGSWLWAYMVRGM